MARHDDFLPSILHIMYIMFIDVLDFTDILSLEINVHCMIFWLRNPLRFNPRSSIFQTFPGKACPQDSLSIGMLCLLIVPKHNNTYNHPLNKIVHFNYVSLIRKHILASHSLSNVCLLQGRSYHFAPAVPHYTLFQPPWP